MSEAQRTTRTEYLPTIEGVPTCLQPAAIEELRAKQYDAIADEVMKTPELTKLSDEEAHAVCESLVNEHLQSTGVQQEDEQYDSMKEILLASSVDSVSNFDWKNGRDEDGNRIQSRRQKMYAQIENEFGAEQLEDDEKTEDDEEPEEPGTSTDKLTDEEKKKFEKLEEELAEIREKWAARAAKLQGRVWGGKQADEDLYKQYAAKVDELGSLHLSRYVDASEEDQNMIATTYLFAEQEQLRDLTRDKLKSTKISRMVEWMNKGSWKQKIGKGLLIGAGAGLAGSFIAGAVGAGVIAGGSVMASRFFRGFALKDHDKRGMATYEEVVDVDGDALYATSASGASRISAVNNAAGFDDSFEEGTKHEQEKRLKAVGYGTAMVGAGALLGYGLHSAAEWLSGKDLTAWDRLKDLGDTVRTDIFGGSSSHEDIYGYTDGRDAHAEWPSADGSINPEDPNIIDGVNLTDAAHEIFGEKGILDVQAGDGHTQVLERVFEANDIHLKPEELYSLHQYLEQHVGEGYINLDGSPDIYEMANGDNGLTHPDDTAKISEKTQEQIIKWLVRKDKLS